MKTRLSRRAFVLSVGGGLAGLSLAWGLGGVERLESLLGGGDRPIEACCASADYQGWLVTAVDKEKLVLGRHVVTLEDTDLPGRDLASKVVGGPEECASWCLSEAECLSFTYAKPTHPAPEKRNVCWLKDAETPRTVPSPFYLSGVID